MKKIIYTLLASMLFIGASNTVANANSNFNMGAAIFISAQKSDHIANLNTYAYNKGAQGDEVDARTLAFYQRLQFFWNWKSNEDKIGALFVVRVPGEMVWGNQRVQELSRSFDEDGFLGIKVANFHWKPTDDLQLLIGRSFYRLPSYLGTSGSPIFGEYADGARAIYKVNNNLTIDAWWVRPHTYSVAEEYRDGKYAMYMGYDYNNQPSGTYEPMIFNPLAETHDLLTIAFITKTDLVEVTPYAAFSIVDGYAALRNSLPHNANFYNVEADTAYLYWAGLTSKVKLGKFEFGVEGAWGDTSVDFRDGGFLVDAYARNNFPDFTLGLMGWYASGNSKDRVGGMISAGDDGSYGVTGSSYFTQGLQAAIVGAMSNPTGTAGVSLEFKNYKPITRPLTLAANLTYTIGTNHPEYSDWYYNEIQSGVTGYNKPYNINSVFNNYLTTKDSILDFGVQATYMASQKLYIGAEIGYMIPTMGREGAWEVSNGYKVGLTTFLNL